MYLNEETVQEEQKDVNPEVTRVEITEENPTALLCCYGTLRLGNGNYNALLEGRSEYLGTYQTEPKYTMLGRNAGFPIVVDNGDTPITYDLFRVSDSRTLERVHNLEGCSGIPGHANNWYDIAPIETEYGTAYMYVQHYSAEGKDNSIIKSGNWEDRRK